MKLLTIAVPAYNVATYIRQCLDSFVLTETDHAQLQPKEDADVRSNATTIMDKLEVLIINDGSTDDTAAIAAEYVQKYPDTFRLINKENGGHGSAINAGYEHATGKYFKIVDGDDWLDQQALVQFLDILRTQDADIVASDFECVEDGTGKKFSYRSCTPDAGQYGRECRLEDGQIHQVIKMHSMTYRTEVIKQIPRPIDHHCFYVDCEYVTYPIVHVKTIYFAKLPLYQYRLGRAGQSVDIKSMQRNREQHMRVLRHLLEFFGEAAEATEAQRRYMASGIALVLENQFQIYISMGLQKGIRGELESLDQEIREKYPDVYHAVSKRSIDILRISKYKLLPFAAMVYKVVKRG